MKSPENRTNPIIDNVVNAHGGTLSRGGRRIVTEALETGLNLIEVTMFVSRAAGADNNHRKVGPFGKAAEVFGELKERIARKRWENQTPRR